MTTAKRPEERDAFESLIQALEDPAEDWRQGSHTIDNSARSISVWTKNGAWNVYKPGALALGFFQRRRLVAAVHVARANELRRKLDVLCLPEEVAEATTTTRETDR